MTSVDKEVVSKYYIACELDNIVVGDNIRLQEGLYQSNMPRLLEALSFTYRANSVFDYIESHKFRWEERVVNADDIILTGMNKALTEIIYSDQVQQSPRKFIEYIQNHPDDERFRQLKPRDIASNRKTILLREHDGSLQMLDGSHRFLSMLMNGETSVNAYVAVLADKDAKPMIGDTVFLRLRRLWQQTEDPLFKDAIERTIVGMIASTSNGAHSVKAYWVEMGPNEDVRAVGKRLIEESKILL